MAYIGTEPANTIVNSDQISTGAVTQPKLGSNVSSTGVAFSAYATTATSIANNTFVKITYNQEHYDTNSNFADSRFTPTVAGYYQISACVFIGNPNGVSGCGIYKNGTQFMYGTQAPNSSGGTVVNATGLVYLNGSTDYVEIYAVQTSGGTLSTQIGLSSWNVFTGFLARAA